MIQSYTNGFQTNSFLGQRGALKSTITPQQSEPGGDDNKGMTQHSLALKDLRATIGCSLASYRGHSFGINISLHGIQKTYFKGRRQGN